MRTYEFLRSDWSSDVCSSDLDAGKTTTLAGYLNLLGDSGLLTGLQKFAMDKMCIRDSPRIVVVTVSLLILLYTLFSIA